MKNFNITSYIIAIVAVLAVTGCATEEESSNTSNITSTPTSLNQAAYAGSGFYDFGYNSTPNLPLSGAPADTDFSRSAMLHDDSNYRLYFFKQGTDNTLYQFAYNSSTQSYEFGYNSIDELTITGIPGDADTSSIAMLHDGSTYRLYMRSASNNFTLYQFGYNPATQDYEFGYSSIPVLFITMSPIDADHARWAMAHDGTRYQLYIGKQNVPDTFYQHAYNPSSGDYEYGYSSTRDVLAVINMPADSIKNNFMMLDDGTNNRFYYLSNL